MLSKTLINKIKLNSRKALELDMPLTMKDFYKTENYYLETIFMTHEIIDDMRGHWEEAYKAALQRELELRDLRKLN